MKTDPAVPRLILDYFEVSDIFGPLDFSEFVRLWQAMNALISVSAECGFDPSEVKAFLLSATK